MTECMQSRKHQYIFEPVCASVLLRRNTSKEPLRSRNTPRIEGQVQLEPMSLRLSQVCVKSWCVFFNSGQKQTTNVFCFFFSFSYVPSQHLHLSNYKVKVTIFMCLAELIFQTGFMICSCC